MRDVPGRVGAARHDMNNDAGTETCSGTYNHQHRSTVQVHTTRGENK